MADQQNHQERLPQGEGFFRNILEALPIPTFVVDSDVRVVHANHAALEFLKKYPEEILLRRGGEILGCINSTLSPKGCGQSEGCKLCVIRGSVGQSIQGGQVHRKKHVLAQEREDGPVLSHLLVTTSPLSGVSGNGGGGLDGQLALLMFEDITELIQLRGLIPVCAWCKKVRDDSQLWQSIEDYFTSHYDLDFTHSICKECAEKVIAGEESDERSES